MFVNGGFGKRRLRAFQQSVAFKFFGEFLEVLSFFPFYCAFEELLKGMVFLSLLWDLLEFPPDVFDLVIKPRLAILGGGFPRDRLSHRRLKS